MATLTKRSVSLPAFPWRYKPPSRFFEAAIADGYAGGSWNGVGVNGTIRSSLAASTGSLDAVGFGLASDVFGDSSPGDFAGHSVNANDILFRYTLAGDANLDLTVDIADLGVLATNWQQSPKRFSQGDSDHSGTVDIADLGMLASNWQQSVLKGTWPGASAPKSIANPPNFGR